MGLLVYFPLICLYLSYFLMNYIYITFIVLNVYFKAREPVIFKCTTRFWTSQQQVILQNLCGFFQYIKETKEVFYYYQWVLRASLWLSGKEPTGQCRRCRFHPWVRKILWRMEWQPTPVFLPGEYHGQRSLVGYSSPDGKESDMT